MKKVIDMDSMTILERFYESDRDNMIKRYENMGLWGLVSTDEHGDIVLYKE